MKNKFRRRKKPKQIKRENKRRKLHINDQI